MRDLRPRFYFDSVAAQLWRQTHGIPHPMRNLLLPSWNPLDAGELKLILYARIGGPGQLDGEKSRSLCLPLFGPDCKLRVSFQGRRVSGLSPGPAFDQSEWDQLAAEIEDTVLGGTNKIGRGVSFSSFRVQGYWRGENSGVQILPAPVGAPEPPYEMAEHPFILEFPLKAASLWSVTNHRRRREHRRLTLLLNLLLAGRTSAQPERHRHFWASIDPNVSPPDIRWVQEFYHADFGSLVLDELSEPPPFQLAEVPTAKYYARSGHDARPLRVPRDLDSSILQYQRLPLDRRRQFDRCSFWMDMAFREWDVSMSSAFAALVSAVEALTDRGTTHEVRCNRCDRLVSHDAPGATATFRAFFDRHAPGSSKKRRDEMYALRSGILHGSDLMELDQTAAFGWDPVGWNDWELHSELWALTRTAIRSWLREMTDAIV